MTLVGIFLVNAALSFALSLLLASILGPAGFGQYAVGLSVTLVVNTALFEWMRLSTTRFYSERVRLEEPAVRATLDAGYWAMSAGLGAVTAVVLAFGFDLGIPAGLLTAATVCGLAYGLCEYRMALARARFLEGPYALLGFLRALFGFLFAAGAALWTADPAKVLIGAALSALLPILFVLHRLRDPQTAGVKPSGALLLTFARYALPLVAASALYQLLPLANRTILASREGFTEAGYFALVSELVTRLFQNLGAALDLVLFQIAVRMEELEGRDAAERQVMRNAAVIGAILIPSATGLWLIWPSFELIFVPEAFRGHLASILLLMAPALAAFSLVQYALNPVFQLRRKTAPVVAAAVTALAIDLGLVLFWPGLGSAEGFAAAQFAGLAGGLVVLCGLAGLSGARIPWGDLAYTLVASALMAAALWPLRGIAAPLATLAVQVGTGAVLYGVLVFAFDVAGLRHAVTGWIARRRAPDSPAG